MPNNDDLKNRLDELFSISPEPKIAKEARDQREKQIKVLDKRSLKDLDLIDEIEKKTKDNTPLPEFFEWITNRIPTAFDHPEEYLVAIDYKKKVYGSQEALKASSKQIDDFYVLGENVGRMYIANKQSREFNDVEKTTIGGIISQISEYIENQRLIQQLNRDKKLQEIAKQVRSSMDTDTILRIAVRALGNTLGRKTFIRLGNVNQLSNASKEGSESMGESNKGDR